MKKLFALLTVLLIYSIPVFTQGWSTGTASIPVSASILPTIQYETPVTNMNFGTLTRGNGGDVDYTLDMDNTISITSMGTGGAYFGSTASGRIHWRGGANSAIAVNITFPQYLGDNTCALKDFYVRRTANSDYSGGSQSLYSSYIIPLNTLNFSAGDGTTGDLYLSLGATLTVTSSAANGPKTGNITITCNYK